uniref:Polyhomeotic homolog 1 n=1 Tax=Monopterus albus TaxID=43700 RepID=A0A3Q3KEB7_MONAL
MDAGEDQNTGTTSGNPQASGNSRAPQIAHMSLYERQAVQALQALQRQPNAAQYFQQLMLQQQISSAQLHNLAAVQQATLAASRQSNTPSNSMPQAPTTVNLSTTSAGGTLTNPRPHGPATSATTTALNQSVQNLALHCASRAVAVKSELPERKDTASFPLCQQQQTVPQTPQQQQVQPQQQQQMAKPNFTQQSTANTMTIKTGNQAAMTVTPAASVAPSSTSSPALPLSQLLLSSSAAPVILVPTSSVPTSTQGYPIGSVTPKASVNTQTLVVQPLQQASTTADKGPVPIQPKTAQGHRLPVQLPPRHPPPILPAPPNNSQATTGGHNPPHIPVQLVGARQSLAGNTQAVALAQARSSTTQESTAGGNVSNSSVMVRSGWLGVDKYFGRRNCNTKPAGGSLKRKSDCDAPNEMPTESSDSAPLKDSAPPLSPAPTKDSAPPAASAFSSPPTLSLPVPLSRVGHGDKDRAPVPQAVVKPQVLTHLIEGFVIQEGAEPFPYDTINIKCILHFMFSIISSVLKCEYCGSLAPASQFRGSKRFCTNTCAKRYNVSCSQHYKTSRGRNAAALASPPAPTESNVKRRVNSRRSSSTRTSKISSRQLPVKCHSESSRSDDISSDGEEEEEEDSPSLSPGSSHSCSRPDHSAPQSDSSGPGSLPVDGGNFLSTTPAHWSVEEVCRFIASLQGCEELAAQFLSQEIDGQALLLLREDHLISTMNIKLGPALKICASINSLRE